MIRPLVLTLLLPVLMGFDSARGREALDLAFHNLYGVDVLAAVELEISGDGSPPSTLGYAYGRKSKGGEVRTLLFSGENRRDSGRALLFTIAAIRSLPGSLIPGIPASVTRATSPDSKVFNRLGSLAGQLC